LSFSVVASTAGDAGFRLATNDAALKLFYDGRFGDRIEENAGGAKVSLASESAPWLQTQPAARTAFQPLIATFILARDACNAARESPYVY
jgi:hypothetical protein